MPTATFPAQTKLQKLLDEARPFAEALMFQHGIMPDLAAGASDCPEGFRDVMHTWRDHAVPESSLRLLDALEDDVVLAVADYRDAAYVLGLAVGGLVVPTSAAPDALRGDADDVTPPPAYPAAPIQVRKLRTSEDDAQQGELRKLAAADTVAADLAMLGPLMEHEAAYTRLAQAVKDLTPKNKPLRREMAYYIGLATGLRLAATRNVDVTAIVAGQGTAPEQAADSGDGTAL